MAETAQEKFLKEQLGKERESHRKACGEWRDQEKALRMDLAHADDCAMSEKLRADLAEERIARLRRLLEAGNDLGARKLAAAWGKRRGRG